MPGWERALGIDTRGEEGRKQDWAEREVGLRCISTKALGDLMGWWWRTLELGGSSRVVLSYGEEARPFSSLFGRPP